MRHDMYEMVLRAYRHAADAAYSEKITHHTLTDVRIDVLAYLVVDVWRLYSIDLRRYALHDAPVRVRFEGATLHGDIDETCAWLDNLLGYHVHALEPRC